MKIHLAKLRSAASSRPAGYLETVLAAGQVDGDWLRVTPCAYAALQRRFAGRVGVPPTKNAALAKLPGLRLGDKVAAITQPIVRAIDRFAGTNLANCRSCKKRQRKLNELL